MKELKFVALTQFTSLLLFGSILGEIRQHEANLEANHVKNISKKKPAIENIHKYLVKHQLTLDKVLLQVLLDNLVEENNLEIYESNSNEICYNVKKNTHVIEDQDIDTDAESLTAGTPIYFRSDTLRKKSSKKSPDIRELVIDIKMDSLHKKGTRYDNFHICYQLNLQQKEYIKFQNNSIEINKKL